MPTARDVSKANGTHFQDGEDHGRVLVFGRETAGRYSLMEYIVAPRSPTERRARASYGVHRHLEIEETFVVQEGRLEFLLADKVLTLGPGDFVRVPAGTRHGFANRSGKPVRLLVTFCPGGFEDLFVRHRSDQEPPPRPLGFIEEAVIRFGSVFEDHPDVR
jgi:mannose-6-phosphate isomerase-like protein (cupin superfamily)